ncbi:MAG: hypothetical protein V2A76_16720 [Planctomycetota bacterium]
MLWADDASPISGARLILSGFEKGRRRIVASSRQVAFSGADGSFAFERALAGNNELDVGIIGHPAHSERINVPEGGTVSPVEIRITRGIRVHGHVELPERGTAVRGLGLQFQRPLQAGMVEVWQTSLRVTVDSRTREFFADVPDVGTYRIIASARNHDLAPGLFEVYLPAGGLENVVLRVTSVRELEWVPFSGRVAEPTAGESPIVRLECITGEASHVVPVDRDTGLFPGKVLSGEYYEIVFITESGKRYRSERDAVPAQGLTDLILEPTQWR